MWIEIGNGFKRKGRRKEHLKKSACPSNGPKAHVAGHEKREKWSGDIVTNEEFASFCTSLSHNWEDHVSVSNEEYGHRRVCWRTSASWNWRHLCSRTAVLSINHGTGLALPQPHRTTVASYSKTILTKVSMRLLPCKDYRAS